MKIKQVKYFIIFLLIVLISGAVYNVKQTSFALEDGVVGLDFVVYDENNNYLFEKAHIQMGDYYVGSDYNKYEIVYVNDQNRTGIARFIEKVEKPKIKFSEIPAPINIKNRTIGLYSTHNDESYLPSDGYYTIYGKGGIHDVGNRLKNTLSNLGVKTIYDETLHIPHNSSAYSRSNVTAKRLLNNNELDALFDIHRDGIPRSYYATTVNGVERSKVRIVVGKANSKMKKNEEFALYLKAVADELYPWLISDIYYASGHYNQALFEKALLFEMGTYLIEKELVYRSIEPLSHVINVTLYNTTVNSQTGELEIGGQSSFNAPLINDLFNNKGSSGFGFINVLIWGSILVMIITAVGGGIIYLYVTLNNRKSNKNNKVIK